MNFFYKFFERMMPFGAASLPSAPAPKPSRKPRAKKPPTKKTSAATPKKKPATKKK